MRRISSRWIFFTKRVFSILWFWFLVLFLVFGVAALGSE